MFQSEFKCVLVLLLSPVVFFASASGEESMASTKAPNVVLIMADDSYYSEHKIVNYLVV